ncbi:TRAP transporter substrate-binding protein [Acuticoccus kandeliae]|uniref:TRAP transporter substrate-binding protein n=1 Tax=Acuticoccus kandeliae TaxID=2073160 RepID=UPI0013003308|nr:TRAP transporter substrate-binding protein [Acuticoccus kandeliae]
MMNSTRTLVLAALATALLPHAGQAADVNLRFGTVYKQDHSNSRAAAEFERLVEEKSNGAIEVEVFYGEEIGSEREMAEMTRLGGLEMVMSGLPGVGAFVPELEVMEAFYTYADIDDLIRVSRAVKDDFNALMEPKGFHLISMMYQGPRNVMADKPIHTPADMAGLKIRIPKTPLFIALAQQWGATPTAIALSETYTSLESGVVEAVDGASESLLGNGFYEHAPYLIETRHNYYPQPIVISMQTWESLTDDQKRIIEEAGIEASDYQAELLGEATDAANAALKSHGVTFIEPDDLEAFRTPVLAAMDTYFKDKGETVYAIYQHMLDVANADED